MMKTAWFLTLFLPVPFAVLEAAETAAPAEIDRQTLDQWAAPYRGWHYWPEPVVSRAAVGTDAAGEGQP